MKTVWSFLSIKFECCKNTTGELASEQQQRIYRADEQTYTHSEQAGRQTGASDSEKLGFGHRTDSNMSTIIHSIPHQTYTHVH